MKDLTWKWYRSGSKAFIVDGNGFQVTAPCLTMATARQLCEVHNRLVNQALESEAAREQRMVMNYVSEGLGE